ncbi:ornithine decarboxylase [Gammaproteobacteria bacterium AS21]
MPLSQEYYAELGFYHQVTQLRSDTWGRLSKFTELLQGKDATNREFNRIRKSVNHCLNTLDWIEKYHAFPSTDDFNALWEDFNTLDHHGLNRSVKRISRALSSDSYRRSSIDLNGSGQGEQEQVEEFESLHSQLEQSYTKSKPYFELLVVDDISSAAVRAMRQVFRNLRSNEDEFIYDVVVVPSFEDAITAILINKNIQACILRQGVPMKAKGANVGGLDEFLIGVKSYNDDVKRIIELGKTMKDIRPELDLYLIANIAAEKIAGSRSQSFRRIFYRDNDYLEKHHCILSGVDERYNTPFFNALKKYSRKPTGIFHAMPVSRGKSAISSNWIGDMVDFYGINIFLAETSTTSGGLDSLLQPHGPLKKAQEYASRAFGSHETFFVTNGTSTANKIVVQALIQPGDIVMVDRDCHKSHHYGMVLSGAHVCYLDSYPINEYSMYGAVPIREIKKQLLEYKRAGKLDKVKMLLLTNCTFDGIVYNVRRVMEECLAIKPDLVFLWDEAWFAFASFNPIYRQRTGMHTARTLRRKFKSEEYKDQYAKYSKKMAVLDPNDDATWLDNRLIPDPTKARIRTYTTHSTHKTLTSLRQGSMIHIFDQDYNQKVEGPFHEAYMTHTTTSPNYQILASLDLGRRQVELEGYGLVHRQLEIAMSLRSTMYNDDRFNKYFKFLVNKDMVPKEYRESGVESYYDRKTGFSHMEEAWRDDEFVVDPTRITLEIGNTGIDGDTFKNQILMDKHGIQINKTSRNTVLFMINIGTTRSATAHLIEVFQSIVNQFEHDEDVRSPKEREIQAKKVKSLTQDLPPLPDFSYFHNAFRCSAGANINTPEGNIRDAFFLSYNDENCEYFHFEKGEMHELMKTRELVSTSFVIPYPPGFPILVPGQVISEEIIDYMLALDVTEIHGYRPDFGLGVFTEAALETVLAKNRPVLSVPAANTEVVISPVKKNRAKQTGNK